MKYLSAGAAVLLTTVFAGFTVSAEEEWITDESSHILQEGGLYETSYEYKLPTYEASTNASLEATLITGWKNYATEINVSQYNLTNDKFRVLYYGALNDHPEIFYAGGGYSYYTSGSIVTRVVPKYTYTKTQATSMKNEMNAVIDDILGGIQSDWSEAAKALYIHEWLTVNTTYVDDNATMYDVLVKKQGICQGYALTNDYLLEQVGIESKIVSSDVLNHAWNLVEIDGVWYYTDVTWDLPNVDSDDFGYHYTTLGASYHNNFLRSRDGITSTNHTSTDWTYRDENVYNTVTGTKYDDYFWRDISTEIYEYNDKWFYFEDHPGNYYLTGYFKYFNFDTDESVDYYTYSDDNYWIYKDSSGTYYPMGNICTGFAIYNGSAIFNTPKSVYSIDLTGVGSANYKSAPYKEYTLSSSYTDSIYGFVCGENGVVSLTLKDDFSDTTPVYQNIKIYKKARIIKQPTNFTGKVGETATFTVKATGATSYQWYQNTGNGWTAINTSVGRSKTFSIGVTSARAKYQYRCVVSDGTTSLTTNAVKMIVDEDLAITSQPSNYIGAIGSTAKFTVGATGAISYQWYQNTGAGWTAINTTAGRSNTFSVGVAEFRLGYLYRCVVSDGKNTITSDEVQMYIG